MSAEIDLDECRRLVEQLDSVDAFERRDAIERLERITRRRFDFEWTAAAATRRKSVRRWMKWLREEEGRRRGARLRTTISALTGGQLTPEMIDQMSEPAKMSLLKQVLAQAGAEAAAKLTRPPCEQCQERPATVTVTEWVETAGHFVRRRLCEVCAG